MPASRRTQRERKAESYRRLLDAAQKVLSDKGYAGATIGEIVKEAGYSQGAFYNHWTSKDHMVMDLVRHVASRQLDHLRNRGPDSGRFFEDLRAESGDPRLFFELWLMAVRGHPIADFLREHYRAWRDVLSEMIRAESESAARIKAALLIALFDGLLIQHELEPDVFAAPEFQQAADRMIRRLAEG
jgi:AcrR family transcriptional regulator